MLRSNVQDQLTLAESTYPPSFQTKCKNPYDNEDYIGSVMGDLGLIASFMFCSLYFHDEFTWLRYTGVEGYQCCLIVAAKFN